MFGRVLESRLGLGLVLLLILVCFAANSAITRFLVVGALVHPYMLTVIRFVSGLVALQVLALAWPGSFHASPVTLRYVPGALFLGIYAVAISYGYVSISAAAGVLIFYGFVVMSMATFSVVRDGEPVTARLVVGQLAGIAGIAVITFAGLRDVSLVGAVLMAITGTAWGLHSAYARRFDNPFAYTYNCFLLFGGASLVILLGAAAVTGGTIVAGIGVTGWGWALFMGMVSTALSYALWHRVLLHIRASQAGVAQLLVPVLTGFMGVVLLGEQLTLSLVLGGALVLAGIFLNTVNTGAPSDEAAEVVHTS